ncbi:MAG: allophanate hydrolase, partial [Rhodospirillales bacterium]|nr:allophanate hydrolase [Rhodospirillales bacterium]
MTAPALLAVAPTPFVTVQDAGRQGWQRFGVSRSGAMDIAALAMANALVGNPAGMAALEFAHAAGAFRLDATSARIAVTGGRFACFVDDWPIPPFTTFTLTRGQTLRVGGAPDAVWGYIAVAQGFDIPAQLGSQSTHARSGIGGFAGRVLREGDALPLASDWVRAEPERTLRLPPAQ